MRIKARFSIRISGIGIFLKGKAPPKSPEGGLLEKWTIYINNTK